MSTKGSRRTKQEIRETIPEKKTNKRKKGLVEVNDNIENNGPAVVVKSSRRRKKPADKSDDNIVSVPKKIKKETLDVPINNVKVEEKPIKKKKNKGDKTKHDVIMEEQEDVPQPLGNGIVIKEEDHTNVDLLVKKKEEITWPDPDVLELISRMEQYIPENDNLVFSTRVEKLEWTHIAFNNYSIEDCKKTWYLLQKRLRKYRLLKEVLDDARHYVTTPKPQKTGRSGKRHPEQPRRPLSAYIIYYLKKRNKIMQEHPELDHTGLTKLVGQIFKNLSPEKKEKYERLANKSKEEYRKNLKMFYENHPELKKIKEKKVKEKPIKPEKPPKPEKPEKPPNKAKTPFGLYYSSELRNCTEEDKAAFKEKCKEKWKKMSDKKKLHWINLAEEDQAKYEKELENFKLKHPEFQEKPGKPVLTKEEKNLKERVAGKPVKPPNSAYGLYSKMRLKSEGIKDINPKDRMNYIANEWKTLPEKQKNEYRDQVNKMNEHYKLEFASYLESLPEDKRQEEIQKQKRKVVSTKVKRKVIDTTVGKRLSRASRKSIIKPNNKKIETKSKFNEPEQPPVSPCKYYALYYHKGGGDPNQAWKALSAQEKDKYEKELIQKKQIYIVEFEKFLKSLSKEELEEFSKSRQQQSKSDDESTECSSDSDNEDDDEEEDEEEEEEEDEDSD